MSKNNNVIKIKGKLYDAQTGAPLSESAANAHEQTAPADAAVRKGQTIQDVVRNHSKHASSHTPQPAKTLMRHSVKKPVAHMKKPLKAHSQTDSLLQPTLTIANEPPVLTHSDSLRLQHAKHIPQSKLISRFGAYVRAAETPPANTQPMQPFPSQPVVTSAKPKTTADLLQHALEQATSHEQPAPKHDKRRAAKHRRAVAGSAAAVALVAIVGLFASQNLSSIKLQAASAKAGFSADVPSYQPPGFRLGELNYSAGQVALNYVSNSDSERRYSVIEKSSDWDSQALREIFVIPNSKTYQTRQSAGQTYYLYGEHNITWVNGNIWYQVKSQDALGDQQLMQLAQSL